jgi:hypothetical protein
MNFDHSPSAPIAAGAELLGERIRSQLEARGFEVLAPEMSATLALWKQCSESVGGIADASGQKLDRERYARARSELVRRTLESLPADGAVSAAVLVREARYNGNRLAWDGVMRPVLLDMGNTNRAVLALKGKDMGVSLRTTVFDREGRNIFERYVGLEPLRRFRVKDNRLQISERTDLFQDEAMLEQSVALSFQPWLTDGPK